MTNKTNKWILKWESRHPYFRMEFYFRGEKAAYAYGSANKKLLGISRNNVMQCYYDSNNQKDIRKKSLSLLLDRDKMVEYFRYTNKAGNSLLNLLSKKIDYNDKAYLKKLLSNIVLEYQKLYTCHDLSRPEYFYDVEKKLKEVLSEHDFIIATTPIEQNTLDKEREEFLMIVKSQDEKKLLLHQKKYGWIGASEDIHPWSIDFFINKYRSLTDEQASREIEEKKKKKRELSENQKRVQVNNSDEINYLCEIVKKIANLRLETRLNWAKADRLLNKILESIAQTSGITSQDIFYYNEKEILNLIDGRLLNQKVIDQRKEGYILRYDEMSEVEEFTGKNDVSVIEEQEGLIQKHKNINIIKGSIANKGYAKGQVKVINALIEDQTEASEKMNYGDVLVTGMTRPHLMPAISKASAIITDEGGITSHAAIVARELKIPCIIGTKIATKILKDGDLVEVDAEKGVIRIINKD